MTTEFDTTKPSPARVHDFILGGRDNFAADRAHADRVMRAFPEGGELAWANRRFMWRSVRYCATHVGQIVDVGTGIPSPNVAEVATRANHGSVVVGVDSDPVVLSYGRAPGEGRACTSCPATYASPSA
ncbi:SAM-dependent methyltransferase [Nonomuraea antimicrobica]